MITDSSPLSAESCLLEDQSGQENADALPAEDSFRASLEMDAMGAADLLGHDAVASGVPAPRIHRSIQCRGATPMARGKHNIDTIILHTPEGHVPGTLSVLSGTRAGFDFYLPPSGELYKCNDYLRFFSWHAGDLAYNRRSVGIEQWDFAANMPNAPDSHYARLAELCAYLVETLDLAIRHAKTYGDYGFIAHGTVTPHARWDPGKLDYDKLLSLVSDLVKGRSSPVPPVTKPEIPVNGEPRPKIWLPNLERTAAGQFEEKHLGVARVMTLDGEERAVIVPKGISMRVPKPGEESAPEPVEPRIVEPSPEPLDFESSRMAEIIDAYFASLPSTLAPYAPVGATIVEEAKKANLHITSACALVEQESAGRNVFGADWGTRGADAVPFAHLPVTRERASKLISYVRSGGVSNGVGLTQLTWRDFIYDAESRGGAHLPKNQCAVGFDLLASYYGKYPYLEAIGAYNAGESNRRSVIGTYSRQFAAKHEAWRRRLAAAGEVPPETVPSDNGSQAPNSPPPTAETPTPETPRSGIPPITEEPITEKPKEEVPKNRGARPPRISKAAKAIVAAAVPVVSALLLWAQTGTLDETEFSVGATGLLTALLVYFVPNTTDDKD